MKGQAWKFGDDIDTDIIVPGRYLIYTDEETLSQHCMEGLDPDFNNKCKKGDFIVAGKNFGCNRRVFCKNFLQKRYKRGGSTS